MDKLDVNGRLIGILPKRSYKLVNISYEKEEVVV